MTTWKIDNMHSEVGFKVRRMVISNVTGTFDTTLSMENEDISQATFDFNAAVDSIQTGVADRDGYSKSPDFF
ncbi:MAG: YceI family protein [Flavobacteriales bacterium]